MEQNIIKNVAAAAYELWKKNGGATVMIEEGDNRRYVIGGVGDTKVIPIAQFAASDIEEFLRVELPCVPAIVFGVAFLVGCGVWTRGDTVVLDLVDRRETLKEAQFAATKYEQEAFYDSVEGRVINVRLD